MPSVLFGSFCVFLPPLQKKVFPLRWKNQATAAAPGVRIFFGQEPLLRKTEGGKRLLFGLIFHPESLQALLNFVYREG